MQKVTLLSIGSLKSSWAKDASGEYIDRLKRMVDFEIVELPPSKNTDPARQQDDESDRLLDAIKKRDGDVFLLDEHGNEMSSIPFAKLCATARDQGRPMIFVLGGAYGFNKDLKHAYPKSLRLSSMTFPHELCRVVFLEQLYRAQEIMRGSGYHH